MKQFNWGASALAAAVLLGTSYLMAADEAKPEAAKPAAPAEVKAADATADEKPAKAARKPARLTKPWSQLTSLSAEQSDQIRAIHRKALDEVKAIQAREKSEIMAVLTDAQKAELQALAEQMSVEKKTKKPAKKEADAAMPKKGEAAEAAR